MQTEGIEFIDRFDVTRIAFDLVKQGKKVPLLKIQLQTLE